MQQQQQGRAEVKVFPLKYSIYDPSELLLVQAIQVLGLFGRQAGRQAAK